MSFKDPFESLARRYDIVESPGGIEVYDTDFMSELAESGGLIDDELFKLGRQSEAAAFRPDGMQADGLEQAVQIDEFKRQEAVKLAPYSRVVPESCRRGLLGGQAEISDPNKLPERVVFWVGLDEEAYPVSVAFAPVPLIPADPPSGTIIRPFARVEFGTHNGKFVVDIDVGRGKQITIPGSTVAVSVGLDPTSNTAYRMAASIGYFTVVRTEPLTRTLYVDDSTAGNTTTLVVPNFASSIWFERAPITPQVRLDFLDANGDTAYTRIIASNGFQNDPIRIAGDIKSIVVTNQGIVAMDGRAIFGLSI